MSKLIQQGGGRNRSAKNRSSAYKTILRGAELNRLLHDLQKSDVSNLLINQEVSRDQLVPAYFGIEDLINTNNQNQVVNFPNNTTSQDLTPVLQNPFIALAKSAPMMYGVYPALAALAARSLYNNYYASGGKTKKRSQRKRQTRKRQ